MSHFDARNFCTGEMRRRNRIVDMGEEWVHSPSLQFSERIGDTHAMKVSGLWKGVELVANQYVVPACRAESLRIGAGPG